MLTCLFRKRRVRKSLDTHAMRVLDEICFFPVLLHFSTSIQTTNTQHSINGALDHRALRCRVDCILAMASLAPKSASFDMKFGIRFET